MAKARDASCQRQETTRYPTAVPLLLLAVFIIINTGSHNWASRTSLETDFPAISD